MIYPEEREAAHPTTSKMLERFASVSTYSLIENDCVVEEYRDDLTETQKVNLSVSINDNYIPLFKLYFVIFIV